VTAVVGIKRLGLAVVAIAAAGAGVLAAAPLLIPASSVKEAVQAEIRAVTGLDPVLRGSASVSLFPSGSVTFEDVSLGGTGPDATSALVADQMVARVRFFPLLMGHVQIADVVLVRPTISVTLGPRGRSNWSTYIETLARALGPHPDRTTSFSEIRIGDGTIVIRDEQRRLLETLTNVEMALAWPSIARSFGATGRFTWHGQPVDAALSVGDFVAALTGERAGIKLRLAGPPLNIAYDGYMSTRPTLRMEGTLSADAVSLRDTLRWTGQLPPPGGGFGRFALKAKTSVNGSTVSLSGVNVELDGNIAEGVLTFVNDTRRALQGTLASENLDLSPYISTVRMLTGSDRGWNRLPISLAGLHGTDVDLRLSAANVTIAAAKLGRTAIGGNLRNGQMTVTVGESQAYGGLIQGSFGLADSSAGANLRAQLQFTGVNLEQCLGEIFGIRRLEGTGNLGFTVEATGSSIYALTKSLTGNASMTAHNGSLAGLNVEHLLRRLERRPLSGSGDFRSGRTAYNELAVNLRIADGNATVDDMRIDGPAVKLSVGGVASIPERDVDLKGIASLIPTSAATPGFDLPFVVQGPWDDPLMLPDTDALIRRSGAAAPLLNTIRNRSTRDTVRSAIERLTSSSAPAAAPAAETSAPAAEAAPPAQ